MSQLRKPSPPEPPPRGSRPTSQQDLRREERRRDRYHSPIMLKHRRPWHEELDIIDRTMKAISGITDPEELVDVYWNGIGELIAVNDYLALSRRNVEPPFYLITRSSR